MYFKVIIELNKLNFFENIPYLEIPCIFIYIIYVLVLIRFFIQRNGLVINFIKIFPSSFSLFRISIDVSQYFIALQRV